VRTVAHKLHESPLAAAVRGRDVSDGRIPKRPFSEAKKGNSGWVGKKFYSSSATLLETQPMSVRQVTYCARELTQTKNFLRHFSRSSPCLNAEFTQNPSTCLPIVRERAPRISAISLFRFPWLTQNSTSASRLVRPSLCSESASSSLGLSAAVAILLPLSQNAQAHWVVYRKVYVYHHGYHRCWHHGYWSGGFWHPGCWF
jgi:hypothetical protein